MGIATIHKFDKAATVSMSFAHLRLLVVDDDEFMLEVMAMTLSQLAIDKITTANNAHDALAFLNENNQADVILCDLNMPGMDGIEFLRHLANQDFSGGILLMSSEDKRVLKTAMALAQAHNLNVLGAIKKPVSVFALSEVLTDLKPGSVGVKAVETEVLPHELEQAINNHELVMHYQPKVDIESKRVIGVECLVRWQHPEKGLIMPDKFIALAEEHGLIDNLTDQVVLQSLACAGKWSHRGLNLKVAINISANSLERLDLPEFIVNRINEFGLDMSNVTLEITESKLMGDAKIGLDVLTRLSLKKISLSIDDFGTGYSTLGQLQQFPFVELKIDRSFVNGAHKDENARAILVYCVELAKKLDMSIVAEGVETEQDWNLVRDLGCDSVQGYYIAKPMDEAAFLSWLQGWERAHSI